MRETRSKNTFSVLLWFEPALPLGIEHSLGQPGPSVLFPNLRKRRYFSSVWRLVHGSGNTGLHWYDGGPSSSHTIHAVASAKPLLS